MTPKAVPVVLRRRAGALQLLAFVHPRAGHQIVKGTVRPGEPSDRAARRELCEEAGLTAHTRHAPVLVCDTVCPGQRWHFHAMAVSRRPYDAWRQFTKDGGGLWFSYFWHPLSSPPDERWHPTFQRAMAIIAHHAPLFLAENILAEGQRPTGRFLR